MYDKQHKLLDYKKVKTRVYTYFLNNICPILGLCLIIKLSVEMPDMICTLWFLSKIYKK